jgi:hypothetical protein
METDIITLPEIILQGVSRLGRVQIVKVMKKINQMNIRVIRLRKKEKRRVSRNKRNTTCILTKLLYPIYVDLSFLHSTDIP